MSFAVSRVALRRSRFPTSFRRTNVRNATTETSSNAGQPDAGKGQMEKVSQGLSRVTSSAGGMSGRVGSMVNSIGGRTGRMIAFVQSLIPPTIHYSRVALEVGKMILEQRKMSPPSLSTFQAYMQPMINAMRHPMNMFTQTTTSSAMQPMSILQRMRNVDNQQMVNGAVVACEALGFFTVGQMIGRRKIIGYRTSHASPEAQVHH